MNAKPCHNASVYDVACLLTYDSNKKILRFTNEKYGVQGLISCLYYKYFIMLANSLLDLYVIYQRVVAVSLLNDVVLCLVISMPGPCFSIVCIMFCDPIVISVFV